VSPGTIDAEVVRRHLMALERTLSSLRRHCGRPVDALRDDDERWAVERGLQLCAQNALDVATHVAAGLGQDVPDYASSIDVLADTGVLPRDFAFSFRGVAGFRNVVVHGYLDVDVELLHRLLNHHLGDFETFSRQVEDFLDHG
jgi:uncharacterized protein YutE (UPF0331/DUF86 family)